MPSATATGIGQSLRAAREALSISIEEAAWRTRTRREYLRALERERFQEMGHHAFVRSHLHSYARFLGLDAVALVREYDRRCEPGEPSPIERLHEQVRVAKRPPRPNWLLAGAVAALLLIGASVAGIVRGPGPRSPADESLVSLPTLPPRHPGPEQAFRGQGLAPPARSPAGVSVEIVVTGRSWIRVAVDGAVAFEGTLTGGAKTFSGREAIDVILGNAGAVRLMVNGTDLGSAGRIGQVYRARFAPRGLVTAR